MNIYLTHINEEVIRLFNILITNYKIVNSSDDADIVVFINKPIQAYKFAQNNIDKLSWLIITNDKCISELEQVFNDIDNASNLFNFMIHDLTTAIRG